MYMTALPVCAPCMCLIQAEARRGCKSPETEAEGGELPSECWASNTCPLEQQEEIFTAEPACQSISLILLPVI